MRELMVDRRKSIMEDLYQNGSVKASTLASIHNVGIETIRRDLKKLADEYGFELTYGGAYIREISPFENYREKPLSVKRSENQDAKSIIAKKAAQLVDTGDIIALNSGSTTESMLPHLENKTPLNLLTLDINIAYSASKITGLDVFFPGGKIRFQSGIAVGLSVREYINLFHIDKLFFGASAVSLQKGITHPVIEEIEINQDLIDVSNKRYLLVDSSKFNKVGMLSLAPLSVFDAIIVDDQFPDEYRRFFELQDIQII